MLTIFKNISINLIKIIKGKLNKPFLKSISMLILLKVKKLLLKINLNNKSEHQTNNYNKMPNNINKKWKNKNKIIKRSYFKFIRKLTD